MKMILDSEIIYLSFIEYLFLKNYKSGYLKGCKIFLTIKSLLVHLFYLFTLLEKYTRILHKYPLSICVYGCYSK